MEAMMKENMKDEEKWRAEDDARTLEHYQEVFKDKKRLNEAKKILEDRMSEIKEILK